MTNEFLSRVFGAYIFNLVKLKDGGICKLTSVGNSVSLVSDPQAIDAGVYESNDNLQLILTPLSEISEEHAKEIRRILDDVSDDNLFDMDTLSEWMDEIFTGNCAMTADYVSGRQFQELLDFLRSKGYDCGYADIPSLIQANIAVQKTK